MSENITESLKEVFKSEMEAQERLEELVNNNDNKEVAEAALDLAEDLIEDIESNNRIKYTWATVFQIAQATNSDQMKEYSGQKLKAWVEENPEL